MGKKAATEMTFNKIIVLILVILVILAVLMFLFRADILEKIKTLPGYESNPDETVNLTADQLKLLNYAAVGAILKPEKREYSFFDQWYFEVYKLNPDYSIAQKIPTRIMLDWNSGQSRSNGNIVIARSWKTDIVIGKMEDNRVSITISQSVYENYLRDYNDGSLPDFDTLMKIDQSKYMSGLLQKTKQETLDAIAAAKWQKILDEYNKLKCNVNPSTCQIDKEGCGCFTQTAFAMHENFVICSKDKPYCYDNFYGCQSSSPDTAEGISNCKNSLGDKFVQAPNCVINSENKIMTAPCSCPRSQDLQDISAGKNVAIETCLSGQYCYSGTIGCNAYKSG